MLTMLKRATGVGNAHQIFRCALNPLSHSRCAATHCCQCALRP